MRSQCSSCSRLEHCEHCEHFQKKHHFGNKKDVRHSPGASLLKTKNVNPATKMSDLLNGHIQKRRVRCGKSNCKCAKGEMHTAFYHVWHCDGRRYQKYIRRSEVDKIRQACQSYRDLQIQLRFGRAEHKQILARARAFLRSFSND